jgi:hypothetical protein
MDVTEVTKLGLKLVMASSCLTMGRRISTLDTLYIRIRNYLSLNVVKKSIVVDFNELYVLLYINILYSKKFGEKR